MKEEQYRAICAACDEVLLAEDATEKTIAIPWLHVIREHPVFLSKYSDLIEPPGFLSRTSKNVSWWLKTIIGWSWNLLQSLLSERKGWHESRYIDQLDVLIVSHIVNASNSGKNTDFYFGRLPELLEQSDYRVAVVLLNHTYDDSKKLAQKWKGSDIPRLVLSRHLGFQDEMILLGKLMSESIRLNSSARNYKSGFNRSIIERAAREALSGDARATLRMAKQFHAIVKKYRPRAIVTTYEGHAWERLLFQSVREAGENVKCIAYQHAALFRYQHGIRRMLRARYNPDYIFTSGSVAKTQLQKTTALPGTPPVYVLGSPRATGDQDVGEAESQNYPGIERSNACLVIPEGIESECNLLFEFSIECAKKNPEMHFIWRLHPIISFNSLAKKNPKLANLPNNVEISKSSLEKDISRCRWALYRGTTAVVQAVMGGLQPIYYSLGEMTLDPLYELSVWRKTALGVEEFSRIVEIGPDSEEESKRIAQDYCSGFYEPINTKELENILDQNISGR